MADYEGPISPPTVGIETSYSLVFGCIRKHFQKGQETWNCGLRFESVLNFKIQIFLPESVKTCCGSTGESYTQVPGMLPYARLPLSLCIVLMTGYTSNSSSFLCAGSTSLLLMQLLV